MEIENALKHAVEQAREQIEVGSFFRVLEPYKAEGHTELIEQVNQVRRYRNWVAHGRRAKRPEKVEPEAAYDRLGRFLANILPPLRRCRETDFPHWVDQIQRVR